MALYRFTFLPWVGEPAHFIFIVEGNEYSQLANHEGQGVAGKSFFDSSENSDYRKLLDEALQT